MDLHHPLVSEFPEYRQTIAILKSTDPHFREHFEEYHRLDDAICRIEEEIEFASDQEIETLKLRRVYLKDWLYHRLVHAAQPAVVPTARVA